jgi:hypothetical protein
MIGKYAQLVRHQYESSRGDSTALFQTILSIAEETGLEEVLEFLQQCVIERRLAWLDRNMKAPEKTGDPLLDGYRLFYESYLGLSIPQDGEIIEASKKRLVTRWWNPCPTLEACQKLGWTQEKSARRCITSLYRYCFRRSTQGCGSREIMRLCDLTRLIVRKSLNLMKRNETAKRVSPTPALRIPPEK